jgi:hypothetical protein
VYWSGSHFLVATWPFLLSAAAAFRRVTPVPHRAHRRLRAVRDPQLLDDAPHVGLDRGHAHQHLFGYLPVGLAQSEQDQRLTFPIRKLRLPRFPQRNARGLALGQSATCLYSPDCREQKFSETPIQHRASLSIGPGQSGVSRPDKHSSRGILLHAWIDIHPNLKKLRLPREHTPIGPGLCRLLDVDFREGLF